MKCAIYARFSSDNQREASIDDQIRKCREFAASKGWIILNDPINADISVSGSCIVPRESFKKLPDIVLKDTTKGTLRLKRNKKNKEK